MQFTMDEIDLKILQHLQQHGRISNVELADAVGLSPPPCLRRVASLEQSDVISRYVALLNPSRVNLNVTVFVHVSLDLQVDKRLEIFEAAVLQRPEVMECYLMTGESDYLLRVTVTDVAAYERFLKDFLTRIEGVASIKSSFALDRVKYSTALPLEAALDVPEQNPWNLSRDKPQVSSRSRKERKGTPR